MVRFNLSTEDIFVKNDRRIKILTSGIDTTERFDENPLMLFEHNSEKILGKWDSVERTETVLSAIPDFDDDELSVDIANKVKRGSVKSASIGIEINDAFLEGDVLIISKSTLLEASIVGIPANKNAKVTPFQKGDILFFSNGEEIDPNEYIKKLNDMKKENTPSIENLNEDLTVKVTELTASLTEKDTAIEDLNSKLEDLKGNKVELGLDVEKLNKEIETLKTEKETLTASLTEKDTKIEDLNKSVLELNNDKLNDLLDSAITEGKITKEAKEDFMELSYDKTKSILEKIIPSDVSLMDTLKASRDRTEEKTYEWYLANDQEGLRKLSKENPTLYKQLEDKVGK